MATRRDDYSLTKIDRIESDGGQDTGWGSPVPTFLVGRYRARIRMITVTVMVLFLIGWISQAVEGEFVSEFSVITEWGPSTVAILLSLVLLGLSYAPIVPATLVSAALVYEVVVCYAIAFSSYWGAWYGVEAWQINGDIVGINPVALFMVFFTILVPVSLSRALMALLPAASAIPVVYLLSIRAGQAPAVSGQQFFFVFVFPYLVTAILAAMASGVIYRLGREVLRAREMGSYRLERLLGQGGMGEVWLASHRLLARPAAVKVINKEILARDPDMIPTVMARFEREARATAHLRSPHTVELYDYGTSDDGAVYYVMEYLEGVDLEKLIDEYGPQPAARVVHILRQACASLAEAHGRGLVHRDIKPANIYVCQQALEYDFVKVLDFGLVKHHSGIEARADARVSRLDTVVGTPAYMPPEMALQQEPIDGRADLYALGCVAHWLLTGEVVFSGDSPNAVMFAHVQKEPQPPSERTSRPVPAEVDELILGCLAKDPSNRPQTAEQLTKVLERIAAAEPWTSDHARAWWDAHADAAPVGVI